MNTFMKLLNKLGKALGMDENMPNMPKHSIGSSKMSNKNRKPNPLRKMFKPVYGGWAHRSEPIGQTYAASLDKIRDIEIITGCRVTIKSDGLYNRSQYLGQPNESVKDLVMKYLDMTGRTHLSLLEESTFRIFRADYHDIPYKLFVDTRKYDNPAVQRYADWYERHYDDLCAEFSENGMDGELDSSLEDFIDDRYETYLRSIQTV